LIGCRQQGGPAMCGLETWHTLVQHTSHHADSRKA
jgi:hypothetical protein